MDTHVFMDISLQLPCFYGYPFGYPWIFIDIHALTYNGFSIQGPPSVGVLPALSVGLRLRRCELCDVTAL